MIEIVKMTESYKELALKVYNWNVLNSTATFSIKPINQEEMDGLLFSGLERFPSYAILSDGEFAGYTMLNRYKAREAYDGTAEVTIYLDREYHGQGIGYKAASFMEEVAKTYNFRALLAVICEENKASIGMFKKLGYFECAHFREVGKKFDRILDVVIYEKLI